MTLYIDQPAWRWRGRLWSHLISDRSLDELHDFARQIPLRYLSFGIDHYDVPEELLDRSLELGANLSDPRDLVRHLRASGLRKSRGKHARTWTQTSLSALAVGSEQIDALVERASAWGVEREDLWVVERPGTAVITCEVVDDAARRMIVDHAKSPSPGATHNPASGDASAEIVVTDLARVTLVEFVIGG